MTEQEEWQYNLLDDENKKKIDLVLEELIPYIGEKVTILKELNNETVEKFLTDNNVPIYQDFKNKLNTPFAIMRYLSLFDEQEELIKKLDAYLTTQKDDNFEYYILRQFKNEIIFTVKDKGELKVKYMYNQEDDNFTFYLIGNTKGFKITFANLKAILSNQTYINNLSNFNTNTNNNQDKISLTYNGMKIIIEKQ